MPLPRCPPGFTDHIFKTAHGVKLPLRVWPAPKSKTSGVGPTPWLLWIHGGGFTCGKWSAPTPWVNRAFADHGYAVVSVGYRLQPQASVHDMVDDCIDAAAWCREHLPSLAGVDPDRWVIGGASSGATLASYTAHLADPPPKAFVNVYGLIDTADYYHHDKGRSLAVDEYFVSTEEEMEQAVKDLDPTKASVQNPWASEMPPEVSLEEAREAFGLPDWEPSEDQFRRIDLYSYVAKHRFLMDVIYRREKFGSDEEFMDNVRAHSPYHLLDSAKSYPATFSIHGTGDDIVRVQQTYQLADKLEEMGVPHGEVYDEGKGHVYDFGFDKPGEESWDRNVAPCMDFINRHTK